MQMFRSRMAYGWLCGGLLLTLLAATGGNGAADSKVAGPDDQKKKRTVESEREDASPSESTSEKPGDASNAPRQVGLECAATDRFFAQEVWPKVGERTCLKCHQTDGDAAESKLVLQATTRNQAGLNANLAAFLSMASSGEKGESRLLEKATGCLDHGGGEVLKLDSTGYRLLERFVRRSNGTPDPAAEKTVLSDYDAPPFFDGVLMMSPERLLRRVTLSLAGRLPTDDERQAVLKHGLSAVDGILDRLMKEDAFYERLKEGFNDIFLTLGYDGNGEEVLSYDHFQPTRLWYQKHDLSKVSEKERQRAR